MDFSATLKCEKLNQYFNLYDKKKLDILKINDIFGPLIELRSLGNPLYEIWRQRCIQGVMIKIYFPQAKATEAID